LRDLKELTGQPTAAASIEPRPSIDLDTAKYVASLQSKSTLAVITESLNRSARDFDAFLQRNVTMDWDTQRQRIYEHFGLVPRDAQPADSAAGTSSGSRDQQGFGRSTRRGRGQGDNSGSGDSSLGGSVFGASNLHKSVIGDPSLGVSDQAALFADTADKVDGTNVVELDDRSLREKESRFIEMMQELNSSRIEGRYFPVFSKFASVEAQTLEQQVTGNHPGRGSLVLPLKLMFCYRRLLLPSSLMPTGRLLKLYKKTLRLSV
jgi:nuclear pore complex protein Nup93